MKGIQPPPKPEVPIDLPLLARYFIRKLGMVHETQQYTLIEQSSQKAAT